MSTIRTSEQTDKILPALLAVQQAVGHIGKDAKNPFYSSNFASLPLIMDAVFPLCHENGLLIMQGSGPYGEPTHALGVSKAGERTETTLFGVEASTRAWHAESGQWAETSVVMWGEDGPQSPGKLISHAKRYTALELFALVADDEGGNGGNGAGADGGRHRTYEGVEHDKLTRMFFGKLSSLVRDGMPSGFVTSELTKKIVRDALIAKLTEKFEGGSRDGMDSLSHEELRGCVVLMDEQAMDISAWMRTGAWLQYVTGDSAKIEQLWNDKLDAARGPGGESEGGS